MSEPTDETLRAMDKADWQAANSVEAMRALYAIAAAAEREAILAEIRLLQNPLDKFDEQMLFAAIFAKIEGSA